MFASTMEDAMANGSSSDEFVFTSGRKGEGDCTFPSREVGTVNGVTFYQDEVDGDVWVDRNCMDRHRFLAIAEEVRSYEP